MILTLLVSFLGNFWVISLTNGESGDLKLDQINQKPI